MTTHGSSSYYISISTSITGFPSGPSGDIVYLYAESYTFDRDFLFKTKQVLDGNSYTTTKGKVLRTVTLDKCVIIDDDGNATTNTQSLNNKITLLDSWQDLDETPIYLIITSETDTVNLALSKSPGTTTQLDYLKGYIKRIRGEPEGNAYMLSLTFIESTLL